MTRVLALTRYERLGASSRVRFLQFVPGLRECGIEVDVSPLLSSDYVRALHSGASIQSLPIIRSYLTRMGLFPRIKAYDLIWLEKEVFPWLPMWAERLLLNRVPYVVDFDDAWFLRYAENPNPVVRRVLNSKIATVMQRAETVVAGNEFLADHARRAGARRVQIIPSVINLDAYPPVTSLFADEAAPKPVIIGWIGTSTTAEYLPQIASALHELAKRVAVEIWIIGARVPRELEGLRVESRPWTEASEIDLIRRIDIGIMPLPDSDWARGKCAYKLLQFMAAGRPAVASPVGANKSVVTPGVNGFLADTQAEWVASLEALVRDPSLRRRIGLAARKTVESYYSVSTALPQLVQVLRGHRPLSAAA